MAQQTNTPQKPSQGKANGISKKEAVRRALAAMGPDATSVQLQPYIKANFGFELTPNHISAAKGDILREAAKGKPAAVKTAPKPAPKPAATPQPVAPVAQPPAVPQQAAAKANAISKKEAVRQALKKLGKDAKPAQLQPYIKATFGLDMTPEHITTTKSDLLRGKGNKGKTKGKQQSTAAKASAKPSSLPQTATAAASGLRAGNGNAPGSIRLEDVEATKALLGRVGANSLRTLIDLLAN